MGFGERLEEAGVEVEQLRPRPREQFVELRAPPRRQPGEHLLPLRLEWPVAALEHTLDYALLDDQPPHRMMES